LFGLGRKETQLWKDDNRKEPENRRSTQSCAFLWDLAHFGVPLVSKTRGYNRHVMPFVNFLSLGSQMRGSSWASLPEICVSIWRNTEMATKWLGCFDTFARLLAVRQNTPRMVAHPFGQNNNPSQYSCVSLADVADNLKAVGVTDSFGKLQVSNLSDGSYSLTVESDGFEIAHQVLAVSGSETVEVQLSLLPMANLGAVAEVVVNFPTPDVRGVPDLLPQEGTNDSASPIPNPAPDFRRDRMRSDLCVSSVPEHQPEP